SLSPPADPRDLHAFPTRRSSDLDHQVLAGAGEGGGFAVDLHGLDGSVGEVEVDPVQVCGGPGVDGGDGAQGCVVAAGVVELQVVDRKSTRLNSSHVKISYAVFCL